MKILVTGGAGFIGSHVADAYRAAGHDVAVVDMVTGADRTPRGVRCHRVDVAAEALAAVFDEERPDVVSHHAAQANVRRSLADPVEDARTNVLGTLRLLDLSVRHRVRQVIFASTAGALYGEPRTVPVREDDPILPTSPYGLHKYLGEQYMEYFRRMHGLNTTVLRYGNVYGPRQDPSTEAGVVAIFAEAMLARRRPVIFGDGTQVRDFVYVGDVADANVRVLGRTLPDPLHVGSGTGTSVNEIAQRLRALTGAAEEPEHGPAIPGEVYRIYLDVRRIRDVLGWQPRVSLEEGLRRTVEWFSRGGMITMTDRSHGHHESDSAGEGAAAMIDKDLLEILACPVCKTPVTQEGDRLVCGTCGRRYPIRDGIPVMLVDEAEPRPA